MIKSLKNEPLLIGITALVAATAGMLAAFGIHITDEQTKAIIAFVVALYVVVFLIRAKVSPTRKFKE